MKQKILSILLMLACTLSVQAQYDLLSAKKGVIKGGYDFWVYTPEDYYYMQESTALIVAPQNPGGPWNPHKLNDILTWMEKHYAYNKSRVYVLGMSLGGYGTLDFAGTYPEKIAAAIALCGGSTLKDYRKLGELPLWIAHGTADRAVSVRESQKVVEGMQRLGITSRLRFDWLPGASHGALARFFYASKTYEWLFRHTLNDPWRPVDREVDIKKEDLSHVYKEFKRRTDQLEIELNSNDTEPLNDEDDAEE